MSKVSYFCVSHSNLPLTCPSQIISHAVLAKPGAPGQTVQARVLPVTGGQQRGGQQTIQVTIVAAANLIIHGTI